MYSTYLFFLWTVNKSTVSYMIDISVYLSICLYMYHLICISIRISIYLYLYLSVYLSICKSIHLYIYLYIKNRFYTRELKKMVNYLNCIEGKGGGLKNKIPRYLYLYIKISFLYIYLSIYLCELSIIYDPMIKSWWT